MVLSPRHAAPHIVLLSLPGYKSETVVNFLSERGIYVSAGAACSRGARSHVLTAMGLPDEVIDGIVRVSFSWENTAGDIDALVEGLRDAMETLARK